jgi:hypothetical protein
MSFSTFYLTDNNPKSKIVRNELLKNLMKQSEYYVDRDELSYLEKTFFSDENIDLINKQLILSVWKKTNKQYRIGYQDKNKLIVVMRYVLLEYGKYLPFDITGQVKELNCIVIGSIMPDIITNIEQKMGYLRDIEKRQPLLDLPISSSSNKTLKSMSDITTAR